MQGRGTRGRSLVGEMHGVGLSVDAGDSYEHGGENSGEHDVVELGLSG